MYTTSKTETHPIRMADLQRSNVLIVDDDIMTCKILNKVVSDLQHHPLEAQSLAQAQKILETTTIDLILLDVNLPDGNGLDSVPFFKSLPSEPEIIIITAHGDADGAELATKNGVWNYIEKPASISNIRLHIQRALLYRQEKNAHRKPLLLSRENLIGNSTQFNQCLEQVALAAESNVNVLITGETGTGKELFARAIHQNSPRKDKSFVVVDCTAIPETLIESTLFGYRKGAFASVDSGQRGLISEATGGTLFLDEIGELSIGIQKTFLRLLQERRYRPLGSRTEEQGDFRLIAATNRHLQDLARSGSFREDLLFRLQAFLISLPPLRERKCDFLDLVQFELGRLSEQYKVPYKGISPDFMDAVCHYNWPGNVRELFNALESVFTVAMKEPIIYAKHLPVHIRVTLARSAVSSSRKGGSRRASSNKEKTFTSYKDFKDKMEFQYLKELLAFTDYDMSKAISISGLSRSRIYALLKKCNLSPSKND